MIPFMVGEGPVPWAERQAGWGSMGEAGVASCEIPLRALTGWWGSGRAPHAPLGEQRAWAFDDPDAAAAAAVSKAGPARAWRFSGQAAAEDFFVAGETWTSADAGAGLAAGWAACGSNAVRAVANSVSRAKRRTWARAGSLTTSGRNSTAMSLP